ncbi:NTP transferase domain-containing protein [Azospirillum sp. RWY-5-1]|uniref:NTP transferase domain-containing protein n=1 Tax=Azospirillum oleiclasticum TaxID=2735135 RepID=A0ABX2TEH9_9PROT|nr:nucleotidyltransferase family protein [Azospirillum oleiclasticum]NYZ15429.1 NTP transferase domain-containing protein [Azospirillum oleiclasticum]NYZ22452.1 NTP transferase domain-containing protein [Azospirillum oleiclasticum]
MDTPKTGAGLAGVDIAVLAGGLGTRIRGVLGDTPKVLAPVGGRAFLGHLLDRLAAAGAQRVVLCLGHLADRVTGWLDANPAPPGLTVVCGIEPRPLGTAGALAHLRSSFHSDPVLVLNGDTFVDADLAAFRAAHGRSGAEASVLCVAVEDAARYGRVEIGADGRIQRFAEKQPGSGTINAGVYLFSAALLDRIVADGAVSLERDVLERAPPGTLNAHVTTGRFIDIGTPESLAAAADVIAPADGSS